MKHRRRGPGRGLEIEFGRFSRSMRYFGQLSCKQRSNNDLKHDKWVGGTDPCVAGAWRQSVRVGPRDNLSP